MRHPFFHRTTEQNTMAQTPGELKFIILHSRLMCWLYLPLLSSSLPSSPILSSCYLVFFLLSSLVPGRHGDSAFARPLTRIPIRLAAITHTHTQTRVHAHTAPVWQCQRPDESNDRLTSVYRPQLTSPWAAHKQLIPLLLLLFSLFFLGLVFSCSLSLFRQPPPLVFISFVSSGPK